MYDPTDDAIPASNRRTRFKRKDEPLGWREGIVLAELGALPPNSETARAIAAYRIFKAYRDVHMKTTWHMHTDVDREVLNLSPLLNRGSSVRRYLLDVVWPQLSNIPLNDAQTRDIMRRVKTKWRELNRRIEYGKWSKSDEAIVKSSQERRSVRERAKRIQHCGTARLKVFQQVRKAHPWIPLTVRHEDGRRFDIAHAIHIEGTPYFLLHGNIGPYSRSQSAVWDPERFRGFDVHGAKLTTHNRLQPDVKKFVSVESSVGAASNINRWAYHCARLLESKKEGKNDYVC